MELKKIFIWVSLAVLVLGAVISSIYVYNLNKSKTNAETQQQKIYNLLLNVVSESSPGNLDIIKNSPLNDEIINTSKIINEQIIKSTNKTNLTEQELQTAFRSNMINSKISVYIYLIFNNINQFKTCDLNTVIKVMFETIPNSYVTPSEFDDYENLNMALIKRDFESITNYVCNPIKCGDNICLQNQKCCNGECVNTQIDPKNCASCGNVCEEGMICCNGECVNTQNDSRNCGQCGLRCLGGRGRNSLICCNGQCMDLQTFQRDPNNCGSCGNVCDEGLTCCNGECKDPLTYNTDNSNCGSCGFACEEGWTCCNGQCKNLQVNNNNCGECGNVCDSSESCCNGRCNNLDQMTQILQNDDNNCGQCGNKCQPIYEKCCGGVCMRVNVAERCGSCDNVCDAGLECNLYEGTNEFTCGPPLG